MIAKILGQVQARDETAGIEVRAPPLLVKDYRMPADELRLAD